MKNNRHVSLPKGLNTPQMEEATRSLYASILILGYVDVSRVEQAAYDDGYLPDLLRSL